MWVLTVLGAIVVMYFGFALRKLIFPKYTVVQPYQRGVLTNKGLFESTLSPGGYWIPAWKILTVIDLRLQVLNVAGQEVLSSDGLSVKISIAGEYSVEDAEKSLFASIQPMTNLYLHAQGAVRDVVSSLRFEEILQSRADLNLRLLELVQPQAKLLGLALHSLRVRDVMLPGELKRAFAQTLTAQKEGQAALERARGETASLRNLANAAKLMEETPTLLQLRALQTMEASKGNTLLLGLGGPDLAIRTRS